MHSPVLKYYGSKFRIANWIIGHFPRHCIYVEPFGGSASVLLQKPRSFMEIYNDLNGDVVNFYKVLRDPLHRHKLVQDLSITPFAREEYELSFERANGSIERARRFVIRCNFSFNSGGGLKKRNGMSYGRTKYTSETATWLKYPDVISDAGRRFSGVVIENRCAFELIEMHDSANTLFYLDPPYLPDTRSNGRKDCYLHDMYEHDHKKMLEMIVRLKGFVVLSGYDNEMYNEYLSNWGTRNKKACAGSAKGGKSSVETIWINPRCLDAINQDLFCNHVLRTS